MSKRLLYSGPLSMFGMKAHIALLEKGLDVELIMVPFTQDHRYRPKHEEVLRINPKGQVPVLIDGDVELFDSTQIFEYLEDRYPQPPLWPQSVDDRARARQLELTSDEVFFAQVIVLMMSKGDLKSDKALAAIERITEYYGQMDARLSDRDWLAGDYSYADIAFYMAQIYADRMGAPMPDNLENLADWRRQMAARPAVISATGPMIAFLEDQNRPVPGFMRQ